MPDVDPDAPPASSAVSRAAGKTPVRARPVRQPPASPPSGAAAPLMSLDEETWRWALVVSLGLCFAHLFTQRLSPLQLYPDEAQYWVWSRSLAFGYFSKPPMIAWIVAATTALLGDAEPFVRVSSPLFHAAAGLFVYGAGRKLYDGRVGLVGLLIYALCPGVQVGAFVVSTDSPLCAFLAGALWLYAELQDASGRRRLILAAGFGLALGLAFLTKYAVLYALIGVALHLIASKAARRAWTWPSALLALALFILVAAPNLIWNATHGFATVAHTATSAAWTGRDLFNFAALGSFLGAQLGVFGPGPFAILVAGGAILAWRRRLTEPDTLLLAWAAPPLVVISVEAFVARAYVNWAAVAYVPGSVVVAAWLMRWKAWRWTGIIVGGQALIAAILMAVFVHPALADAVGASKALKGLRGWRDLVFLIEQRAQRESLDAPLTAVAVDDRYLYNEGRYYGRGYFGVQGPPLVVWLQGPAPRNEAEASAPLTAANGRRVVGASFEGQYAVPMMRSFAKATDREIDTVGLDRKNSRRLDTFLGEGFLGRR